MQIEEWPIDRPIDYPKNARKWSKDALRKVGMSLQQYGWRQPLVVDTSEIIVIGHLRRAAARLIGMTVCPVHVARDLTPAQIQGLRLADNRVHEESTWDFGLLAEDLAALKILDFDLNLTGFNPAEWTAFFNHEPAATLDSADTSWKTRRGQVWQIGRHSLSIADAADFHTEADLICTDPPYDISIDNLDKVLRRHGSLLIVLASDRLAFQLARLWDFRLDFIWHHQRPRKIPTKNLPILFHTHCAVFCAEPKIKTKWSRPTKSFPSVFEIEHEYEDKDGCGYGKSAELFRMMLAGFPDAQIICDPFAGSCATILAAEELQKTCIAFELDPQIAAVGLERMQRAGLKPELLRKNVV